VIHAGRSRSDANHVHSSDLSQAVSGAGQRELHRREFGRKMRVDMPRRPITVSPSFRDMSTTETKQQTPTPAQIPFTTPEVMRSFVTDTGKILPRKYTGLSAKHQRAVTRTLKHSRNMLLAQ
jgi:small subunit ribosomal protein S18